jgi:hypothetical protein
VIGWHRKGASIGDDDHAVGPGTKGEICDLTLPANALLGALRVRSELLRLGTEVRERRPKESQSSTPAALHQPPRRSPLALPEGTHAHSIGLCKGLGQEPGAEVLPRSSFSALK